MYIIIATDDHGEQHFVDGPFDHEREAEYHLEDACQMAVSAGLDPDDLSIVEEV